MSLYIDHCGPIEREQREHAARLRQALFNPPPPSAPARRPDPPPPMPAPAAVPVPEQETEPTVATVSKLTVRLVIDAAAAYFNTTPADLIGTRKYWPLVQQRQIAVYVAYQGNVGQSFKQISRIFHRDHATIMHACRRIQARIDEGDLEIAESVKGLVEKLGLRWPCERPPPPPPKTIEKRKPVPGLENHMTPWSPEDKAELIRLYQEKYPLGYIATRLRRGLGGIATKITEWGIASRHRKSQRDDS